MPRKKRNFLNNARERVGEGYDYSKEKVMESKERAEDFIRDYPKTSVLIAAAIGAAVALGANAMVRYHREPKSFMDKLRDRFY